MKHKSALMMFFVLQRKKKKKREKKNLYITIYGYQCIQNDRKINARLKRKKRV